MPLTFRNLSTSPADPVAIWPVEAVRTALERGDIDDWRRLVAEIGRHPWGTVARQVEEVLGHTRPYGVAELMEAAIVRARRRAGQEERDFIAAEVRRAIKASRLSRAEFASRVGTSTSRLSTYTTGKVTPSASLMVRIRRVAEPAETGLQESS